MSVRSSEFVTQLEGEIHGNELGGRRMLLARMHDPQSPDIARRRPCRITLR